MCGVFGICGALPINFPDPGDILDNLKHRGPDDQQIFESKNLILGHTRLSIQDPGNSAQPMLSNSGDSVISFNGEIYNKDFLRKKVPARLWKTNGDTEILLELIELFGLDILNEIEGMFAFAFYSLKTEELFLGRDSIGEKPLYYVFRGQSLVFSSELRSILPKDFCGDDIDIEGLKHYLKYLYFPTEATIHREIECLRPGNFVHYKDGQLTTASWKSNSWPQVPFRNDPKKSLRTLVGDAVKGCLVSDVPLGVMLSGGLDSSIIALEASNTLDELRTYSVSMPEHSDDNKFAALIAKKIKSNHLEILFDIQDLPELVKDTLSKTPQPFGDTAIIPLRLLTMRASKDVKVLLSGDGADELFSGYEYYDKFTEIRAHPNLSSFLRSATKAIKEFISKNRSATTLRRDLYRIGLEYGRVSPFEIWCQDLAICDDKTISKLFRQEMRVTKYGSVGYSNIQDILLGDQETYLPNDLLLKSDSGGMLSSIEIRSPFLNSDLVTFARNLNIDKSNKSKQYLKSAYQGSIPDEILNRRKQGFGAPIKQWIKSGYLDDLLTTYVFNRSCQIYEMIDFESVIKLCPSNVMLTWNIMSLNIWLEANIH